MCYIKDEKLNRTDDLGCTGAEDRLHSWVLNEIIDNMNVNIYITDLQTDRILFMNKAMKKGFGVEHPEGKIYWQVLQKDMPHRCDFCPLRRMLDDKTPSSSYLWETNNTLTGRVYECYDSLMRWTDGELVHFQHSVDITETKRLYRAATFDELTGAFSRRAGQEALVRTLENCMAQRVCATVCKFDVNGLKMVNDTYGHLAGDRLLTEIAAAFKSALHTGEYLIRLSGDEFLAVLFSCDEQQAEARVQTVLTGLQKLNLYPDAHRNEEFCYGLFVVDGETELSVNEVLSAVDEKLYMQKRVLHIRQATQRANERGAVGGGAFTYDKNRLYDALVQSTDDYIYVCNMKTGTFRYPKSMVEEFDLPSEVIENAAAILGEKVYDEDRAAFLEANQVIADGLADAHMVEYRALNRNGDWVWLRCRGHLERDENGEPSLFAGIITNLGKKNKVDPLTGLFNKFEFENRIQQLTESETPRSIAVLLLDLDDYQRVNTLYDRAFGDEALRIVGQKLQSLLPSNAMLFRLDGDEFGIIIRGGKKAARILFAQIQETFARQQSCGDKRFFVTLSCGCVFAPEDAVSYLDILKNANCALEYAKRSGKNRMYFFSPEIVTRMERSIALTELLRESVENGCAGFEVYYQPVFDRNRRLVGSEALARWRCEKYGNVPPDEFIPLLEKNGLMIQAGRWIFEQAVCQTACWCKQKPDFLMGINLSGYQLEDTAFIPFMADTLRRNNLQPSHIIIELTESYLAPNMKYLLDRLEQIRQNGFLVSMDDFGTGYSSLGVLKKAPVDIVKLDKAFVHGICTDGFDSAFIRLVAELCRIVGIRVCLEGIEMEAEFEASQPLGLDYLQGYLLGRPAPPEQFEAQFLTACAEDARP